MGKIPSPLANLKVGKCGEEERSRFEREAENDGFNIYSGVVKNMGVGQGK